MNIEDTLAPDSTQLDAVELAAGPRIFTITKVSRGKDEQPVEVSFAEFPRVWRPAKSMRRVLAACWGVDASAWIGRRVELFLDPDVTFGKETPGGTRISRLSHIDGPKKIPLLVSRGKSAMFRVEPLPDDAPAPVVSTETLAELVETFRRKGVAEDKWLPGVNHYAKAAATTLDGITEDQARRTLAELAKRPDVAAEPDEGEPFGGES